MNTFKTSPKSPNTLMSAKEAKSIFSPVSNIFKRKEKLKPVISSPMNPRLVDKPVKVLGPPTKKPPPIPIQVKTKVLKFDESTTESNRFATSMSASTESESQAESDQSESESQPDSIQSESESQAESAQSETDSGPQKEVTRPSVVDLQPKLETQSQETPTLDSQTSVTQSQTESQSESQSKPVQLNHPSKQSLTDLTPIEKTDTISQISDDDDLLEFLDTIELEGYVSQKKEIPEMDNISDFDKD
jgi:hypothetical protein